MTKAEAYREEDELRRLEFSWPFPQTKPYTPYQSAVMDRANTLYHYWRFNEPAPCERKDWVCPPRDVEETVENYWRRGSHMAKDPEAAYRGFLAKYGGGYPPLHEWTEELERNFGG